MAQSYKDTAVAISISGSYVASTIAYTCCVSCSHATAVTSASSTAALYSSRHQRHHISPCYASSCPRP